MNDRRPDPEALLERLEEREQLERRAKLKIFFGASAGVGKTYAMLVEAHERRRAGAEVVVGVVETHGRPETGALLEGLEALSRRALEYRGTSLTEFDLDAALARKPALLLLDELAHTNAPGSRHLKRWQDVQELLDAGVDVYTTLNVQHVESLTDVVEQVTGVRIRETVPDSILDRADEIELVDLPPDDLLQRLREGKVYVPRQAERAMENFFRKGNLIALRELALRRTAERVDAQMESYRRIEGVRDPWGVRERILVCVGDAARGLELVRAARRMVNAFRAQWIVLHVERPGEGRGSPRARDHVVDVLGFAEDLGAETAIVSGHRVADEILAFARDRHVTRIVVGKPARPAWVERLLGSVVADLLRRSEDVDVLVIRGESGDEAPRVAAELRPHSGWREYLSALGVVLVCTLVGLLVRRHFELTNVVMIYLLGVLVAATRFGRGPAILASVLSVAAFDFFFVPPHLTFAVSDTQYAVTFLVMLSVAVALSTLTVRLREQSEVARQRERRTAALYRLSRELAVAADRRALLDAAVRWIAEVFDAPAAVLLADEQGRLRLEAASGPVPAEADHERGVAQWVYDHAQPAGLGTPTLPGSQAVYLPLRGGERHLGVLGVGPPRGDRLDRPDTFPLLETFANQTALALERVRLSEEAEGARVQIEGERLRNTLLASVSHDLRTPLAVITGAASSLLEEGARLSEAERRALLETVAEEGERLNRLVGDLLDMTRLESGALRLERQWHSMEEIVGAALGRLEKPLAGRSVRVEVAPDLYVPLDDVLAGQALFNLVENALKHSPPGTPIEVRAWREQDQAVLEVVDRGPGLPPGEEERVFEKFWRTRTPGGPPGVGLGLAICRAIAEAHGGTLLASNRPGGGARFELRLPIEGEPPRIEEAEFPRAEGAKA